jgi:hypothetical protein
VKNIFIGLKKAFEPYSEYLILYYIYRLEGIKENYKVEELKIAFNRHNELDEKDSKMPSSSSERTLFNEDNKNIENEIKSNSKDRSPDRETDKVCETVKCSTCNASEYLGTPEKDYLNTYNFIFNLNHLPIFDETTSEFLWGSNESNWRVALESILNSEELKGQKPMSISNGSFLNASASAGNNGLEQDEESIKKIAKESRTFIDELNNILKSFN